MKVINFRKKGMTYREISNKIGTEVSKSTLSSWCKDTKLPNSYFCRLKKLNKVNLSKARISAVQANKIKRQKYLDSVSNRVRYLGRLITNKDIAKVVLAVIYAAEGSKSNMGSMMFGNSDSSMIRLFMKLMRLCYKIDEAKFRCTVQCRSDQNIESLENYWSNITNISLGQFYKTQVDPRSIGKPTKKLDYKGVCRINYLSSDTDLELKKIFELITTGL
ncbi:MAG: hypothetical protein NT135_01785 [Candidatus Berkelbacteria bacterium]|nr:hypothetical protein [Candidatus Berkelbacteria bacterium]